MRLWRRVAGNVFIGLLLVFVCMACMRVHAQATSYPDKPPLMVGAAWYPEQWPESRWD